MSGRSKHDELAADDDDDFSTIKGAGADHSFSDGEDDANEEWLAQGDYSSRLEEILSDDEPGDNDGLVFSDDEDDSEGFVYSGKDADMSLASYQEQLRDVLDGDMTSDDEISERAFTTGEHSFASVTHPADVSIEVSSPQGEALSDLSASTSSDIPPISPPSRMLSPASYGSRSTKSRRPPFLHPGVSRLRSEMPTPQQSRLVSASSFITDRNLASPSPSQISGPSRASSSSNLYASYSRTEPEKHAEPQSFKWTSLRVVGDYIFPTAPNKANSLLGAPVYGAPTVLAANGMVCVGTESGKVLVFDFKQNLVCVCGDDNSAKTFGPVSALALSHDHTFVGVGHVHGHIQLFDFKIPHSPARTVIPTSIAAVASGRQEGHIYGSRIIALGFIAGRHTAIVSADDQGLAFYHSLGKVLFVDATDVLRILGKYPEEDVLPLPGPSLKKSANGSSHNSRNGTASIPQVSKPTRSPQRKASAILSMAHLPLGTSEHGTDTYQLIALLTPIKLVIVGLKPSPKTWFRRHREGEDDIDKNKSRFYGCLAWFPSVIAPVAPSQNGDLSKKKNKKGQKIQIPATDPVLAFCWGRTLTLLRTFETRSLQNVLNKKTGKTEKVETGKINFEEKGTHQFDSDVLSLQWINANQIIAFRDVCVDVLDVRSLTVIESAPFDASGLMSPIMSHTQGGKLSYQDASRDVQHSVKSYKGKVFTLGYDGLKVGILLSWADKILAFVQDGDFVSAISLARDYYLGNVKGNKNGLPEDAQMLRSVVGEKMSELMVASARYAFSEDRLTDSTHVTPDNRGVDRTSLFEDLVSTCARACVALDDFDFLFEELFSWYDNTGIASIYLRQLEPFVLDNSIPFVPPRITKRLIEMHEVDGKLGEAERIIWHIDPACLDIDQAVTLCQRHALHDALIYVHNTALQDYISPLVLLIGFVRVMQQRRREAERANELDESLTFDTRDDENMTRNAYKVYTYLETLLSGKTYPSEMPMPHADIQKAMDDIYGFLFYGRSKVWPVGDSGKLVLTADEDGGSEPTYPYARLLLRFDAEAFLHTLDVAFEHSYLNESQGISRQIIVKILMDLVASVDGGLSSADSTFVRIFIARNVPKYPQFIHISPTALQSLLVGLASDLDQSTQEDRQLAAEFLLSVYNPRDSDHVMKLFEDAGFYRILRSWYRSEKQWSNLVHTFLRDPAMLSGDMFHNIESALADAARLNKGTLPQEVLQTVLDSVSHLLEMSIPLTALLVEKYSPESHTAVMSELQPESDHKQYAYLRCLLGPPESADDGTASEPSRTGGPATSSLDKSLRSQYLNLLCRYDSGHIISAVEYLPSDFLPVDEVARICEAAKAYDVVVWLLGKSSAVKSLDSLEAFSRSMTISVSEMFTPGNEVISNLQTSLHDMHTLYERGITICRETSERDIAAEVPLEDCWFKLLSSQIDAVQTISATTWADGTTVSSARDDALATLRAILQESFTSLVSVSSTKAVSFPRLFKRLVDSSAQSRLAAGTPYDEFRSILMSMLESYRSEGDMLAMTKRVLDDDIFDAMEVLARERGMGWRPHSSRCATCKKRVAPNHNAAQETNEGAASSITVSRTGLIYHTACFPAVIAGA